MIMLLSAFRHLATIVTVCSLEDQNKNLTDFGTKIKNMYNIFNIEFMSIKNILKISKTKN